MPITITWFIYCSVWCTEVHVFPSTPWELHRRKQHKNLSCEMTKIILTLPENVVFLWAPIAHTVVKSWLRKYVFRDKKFKKTVKTSQYWLQFSSYSSLTLICMNAGRRCCWTLWFHKINSTSGVGMGTEVQLDNFLIDGNCNTDKIQGRTLFVH